jgi:hypothetical protein
MKRKISQPTGVSTFAIRTSQRSDQKLQKSFHLCHPKENYFLKSLPSKIFKTANTQAKQTENATNKMTAKTQKYNDLTMTEDRRPAYNITYTQAGVLCFVRQESGKFKVQFFLGSSVVKIPACV